MNLIINDKGDQSVGIFPTSYTVETPLDHTDDTDAIEFFRKAAIDLFSQFTDGRITAMYEWEIESLETDYLNQQPPHENE